MPKHANDQPKKGKPKTTSPKNKFSQTEANLPMTDSVDWRKGMIEGTKEERLAVINEAVDKRDDNAILALAEVLSDRDIDICDAAGEALTECFEKHPRLIETVPFLIKASKSEIPEVRRVVARVFRDTCDVRAIDTIVTLLEDESSEVREEAAESISRIAESDPSYPQLTKAVPLLIKALEDESVDIRYWAAGALGHLKDKRAIDALRKLLEDGYPDIVIEAAVSLVMLGDRKNVPLLKKLFVDSLICDSGIANDIEKALLDLGVPNDQIERMRQDPCSIRRRESEGLVIYLQSPDQKAVLGLLERNRDIKRIVFENAKVLEALPDRQAWITINKPQLAKDALELALGKLGKKRSSLENVLRSSLGVRIKQLEEAHFKYYADEILDAISQVVRNSRFKDDEELSDLLSQIRYGDGGVCLRYIRREMADLSLGDKCGDCAAKGSVNFGNSVTWLVNPAYQILKMSKGGRFIGKMNFTLGTLVNQDAVIIDALEFNPQTQKGKPYHKDGLECLNVALSFLRRLARKEKRKLFALRVSNSSGAVDILEEHGRHITTGQTLEEFFDLAAEDNWDSKVPLSLLVPNEDVLRTLATVGYEEETNFFYQMLDVMDGEGHITGVKDLTNEKLPIFEREVVNPAQIANPEVATAMRERDFEKASKLILIDSELEGKVKGIFGLPMEYGVSSTFLSTRLEKIYKTVAMDAESLKRTFMVSAIKFVRL